MMRPEREIKPKKPSDAAILGYNLLAFAAYTGLCLLVDGSSGGFVAFIISIAHFVICGIIGAVTSRWAWLLGGFLAVLIGFGTCVSNFTMDTR
ncbi:hypothetical protein LLH06_17465 [Mucilaginibacter daejeonensis]|uniref:hypothetical protein n=1 Tax=Mucilaginibacter daejeonensis TaxID=398049 RepID=UPI001D170D7F|nr:hypothetical protein [Mucilaginibacter daejeonensis]UEG52736.1 hypothetical protein LLH06_17465 [Mucilaginibacter daejeonensis]